MISVACWESMAVSKTNPETDRTLSILSIHVVRLLKASSSWKWIDWSYLQIVVWLISTCCKGVRCDGVVAGRQVVIRSSTPCKLQHSMIFRPAPCCLGQPSMRPISRHARSVRTRKATKLLGDLHFVVFKFSRCKCVLDQIQKWVSVGGGELRSISLYIVSPRFAIQIQHYKAMVPA